MCEIAFPRLVRPNFSPSKNEPGNAQDKSQREGVTFAARCALCFPPVKTALMLDRSVNSGSSVSRQQTTATTTEEKKNNNYNNTSVNEPNKSPPGTVYKAQTARVTRLATAAPAKPIISYQVDFNQINLPTTFDSFAEPPFTSLRSSFGAPRRRR